MGSSDCEVRRRQQQVNGVGVHRLIVGTYQAPDLVEVAPVRARGSHRERAEAGPTLAMVLHGLTRSPSMCASGPG